MFKMNVSFIGDSMTLKKKAKSLSFKLAQVTNGGNRDNDMVMVSPSLGIFLRGSCYAAQGGSELTLLLPLFLLVPC